jgi:hypothetical protein
VLKKEKKKRKITTWIKLSFFPCTRLLVKLSFSIESTQTYGSSIPKKSNANQWHSFLQSFFFIHDFWKIYRYFSSLHSRWLRHGSNCYTQACPIFARHPPVFQTNHGQREEVIQTSHGQREEVNSKNTEPADTGETEIESHHRMRNWSEYSAADYINSVSTKL